MSDERPSAHELEEAENLARALEGADVQAPQDALEVAALLAYARGHDSADPELLARARASAQTAKLTPFGVLRTRTSRIYVGTLAAAAVVLLGVLSVTGSRMAAPRVAMEAPAASGAPPKSSLARMLQAQAAALAHPEQPLSELSAASAQHRRALFAGLSERYGGAP